MKRNEFMPPTTFHKGGDGRSRGFGYGGFSMGKNNKGSRNDEVMPPPPSATLSKHGYSTLTSITANALSATYGIPRVRAKTEEEYFDEDEESTSSNLAYQPAPGSPSAKRHDSDSEEDPLDAYMTALEKETRQERDDFRKPKDSKDKGIRDDIEDEDDEESYYRFIEENPNAAVNDDSDQEIDYDEDGNPIPPAKSKMYGFRVIDPLPPLDHSTIEYDKFEKNFYQEHSDIRTLGPADILQLRSTLGIKVSGPDPPKPVSSFAHFGFDEALMKAVRKSEYTQPTPIQAQGVPSALGGRDIIGIAKTGSGKTAAFLWPMLVHIMDQRELQDGEGPIALILVPTRELSQQIYTEAKKFGKVYNIQVVCCYGGGSKWEQSKALEAGAEIVVGTPGRMIDMIKIKATNLQRVTMLVLDEADRMFDMGFEPQVRSICNHVRPDRQTLLFSATFKKRIERLARDILTDPIRIVQGDIGEANQDITQIVKVMPPGSAKWSWLLTHLVAFTSTGSVLIFVTKKVNSEELSANLRGKGYDNALLHGDMDQTERNKVITAFKRKEMPILVATDVAARGLDIPHIKTVINYDVARDIDTHTHRIGRTGRAGEKGTAYTLITERDKEFAGHLVRNLEGASQEVPGDLMGLAMQTSWFKKSRFKSGDGKRLNVGGRGLGYKERPGLGASKSSSSSYGDNDTSPSARMVGPGTDRLSTMKAAFKAQYTSQFTAAVDQTWQITRKPERPRKKSRWSAPEEDVPPTDQ